MEKPVGRKPPSRDNAKYVGLYVVVSFIPKISQEATNFYLVKAFVNLNTTYSEEGHYWILMNPSRIYPK